MARFSIPDFDKVDGVFKPLPEGVYTVQITKCEDRVGKEKGTKYLNWWLTVTADHAEHAGRIIFFTTMLEPREALFKLKNLCEAVGTGYDASGVDTDRMIGAELKVQVVQETNKQTGAIQNAVKTCMKK